MERSTWFKETFENIENVLRELDEKSAKKLKVNVLVRVVERIELSSREGCDECESMKVHINELMYYLQKRKNKMDDKQYKTTFRLIIKHLVKEHGLVEEGTYVSQWISFGIIFGTAFTAFFAGAIPMGLLIGIVIGSMLDDKAKKEGKVI